MNTPTRGVKMDLSIIVRATAEDKAQLKLIASRQGKSMSQLVREVLIERGYIPSQLDVVDSGLI